MSASTPVGSTDGPTIDTCVPIFLHVPKAAGRSLLSVMRDNYGADRVYEVYTEPPSIAEEAFFGMPERQRLGFDAVAGHLRFGLHEYISRPTTYLTVLRNPIERVLSTYAFVRRKKSHHRHAEVVGRDRSIVEVIESGLLPMLDNGQTRALSGAGADVERCTASHFEQAKANIESHFAVVGLLERFDETLVLCRREFGWKTVRMRQRNAAPGRQSAQSLDPETRTAIAEVNEFDGELYAWAEERFDRKVGEGGVSFQRQLRRLQYETALRGFAAGGRAMLSKRTSQRGAK